MATPESKNGTLATRSRVAAPGFDPIRISFPDLGNRDWDQPFRVLGLNGTEGISQLYGYQLHLVADRNRDIPFEQYLGRRITIQLPLDGEFSRPIHGIVRLLTQDRSDRTHAHYHCEVVPRLWLLTRTAQSRIFQDLNAPAILAAVLDASVARISYATDFDHSKYPERPYCVQYRETDFDFLSRLMEEEGIYYYFEQQLEDAKLVIADAPLSHPELPQFAGARLEEVRGGTRLDDRVTAWRKTQELRSGKVTLWDHSFEFPPSHLEATKSPVAEVHAGTAEHHFDMPFGKNLEIYDYPGGYAGHFDGVNRGGGDASAKLQGIWEDNQRTATIRMQQEALPGLVINGAGTYREFMAGYTFVLDVPFKSSGEQAAAREYLLTAIQHRATQSLDRSGNGPPFQYQNEFSCIPVELPLRPLRRTPKPTIHGTQTAVVVGSGNKDEESFTDKYGRVKVRFFWDRRDPRTEKPYPDSCWIRVAQAWAGQRWGTFFWPRIGQEVVVAFLEGDPDRPIIIGSVYNAEMMPPYALPEHQTQSGIKTRSSLKGTPQNFNELRFEDKKGHEEIYVHAERNLTTVVESCECRAVGGTRTTTIHKGERLTVDEDGRETVISKGDEMLKVEDGKREVHVMNNDELWVKLGDAIRQIDNGHYVLDVKTGNAHRLVEQGNDMVHVKTGHAKRQVDQGHDSIEVKTGHAYRDIPNGFYAVKARVITLEGTQEIRIQVGSSSIVMDSKSITISAEALHLWAANTVRIAGKVIDLN